MTDGLSKAIREFQQAHAEYPRTMEAGWLEAFQKRALRYHQACQDVLHAVKDEPLEEAAVPVCCAFHDKGGTL